MRLFGGEKRAKVELMGFWRSEELGEVGSAIEGVFRDVGGECENLA